MNDVRRTALKKLAGALLVLAPIFLFLDHLDRQHIELNGWLNALVVGVGMPAALLLFMAVGELVVGRRWVGKLRGGFEGR